MLYCIRPSKECYGSAQGALKMPPNVRLIISNKGEGPDIYTGGGMQKSHPDNSPCKWHSLTTHTCCRLVGPIANRCLNERTAQTVQTLASLFLTFFFFFFAMFSNSQRMCVVLSLSLLRVSPISLQVGRRTRAGAATQTANGAPPAGRCNPTRNRIRMNFKQHASVCS